MTSTRVPGSKYSRHPAGRGPGARLWLLALALAMVALVGCRQGSYSLDFFQEMHYQQSYRNQEPPRLSPPEDSVPITGKPVALTLSFEEAAALENPIPLSPEVLERAAQLFQVNCALCHGVNADGQSPVGDRFQEAVQVRPVNFDSDRVRSRAPGQLFWALTRGFGLMPTFDRLLTEEERWVLVHYIRSTLQGR